LGSDCNYPVLDMLFVGFCHGYKLANERRDKLNELSMQFVQLADYKDKKDYSIFEADVTAYSPDKAQTFGDVFRTASNLKVTPLDLWQMKYVAVSRDLKKKYNLKWGDVIYIGFEVQDLMGEFAGGKRVVNTVDLFLRSRKIAKNFGRQKRNIIIVKKP